MRNTTLQSALWIPVLFAVCLVAEGCSSSAGGNDAVQASGAAGALPDAGMSTIAGGASSAGGDLAAGGSSAGAPSTGGSDGGAASSSAGSGGSAAGAGGMIGGEGGAGAAGALATAGAGGTGGLGGSSGTANLPAVSVYLAGDSTVSQYVLDPKDPKSWAGWGQMLGAYYVTSATVVDAAVGGRTARRFIQEKLLDGILSKIKPNDYLFVQFGTNDSNTTATYVLDGVTYPYYAAADTDFKTYLQQYIDGALAKKAIPVLVTPPPRNSAYCKGGRSLANYGQAMIDLGKAQSVAVVDLGLKTYTYLTAICPKPTTAAAEMFFKINADMTIDGTHFQENGARIMAGFVADSIGEDKLALAAYRKP